MKKTYAYFVISVIIFFITKFSFAITFNTLNFNYTEALNCYLVDSESTYTTDNVFLEQSSSNSFFAITGCPANITVNNDFGLCSAVVNYSSPTTDIAGGSMVQTAGLPSGSAFPTGSTINTFEERDGSNNPTGLTCSFNITVNDTENPIINCPGNKTVNNDPGVCSAVVNGLGPSQSDNCGVTLRTWTLTGATTGNSPGSGPFTNASGQTFNVGVTTVTYHVEDAAGNSDECSFTVTVNDTENPSISCPSDITLDNDAGVCGALVNYSVPVGTDNCPGVSTSRIAGLASGATFPIGTTTVTYQVTDVAGNIAECSFDITVNDTENPNISCPSNITVSNDPGVCGAVVSYSVPVGTDNCSGVSTSLIAGLASGSTFPIGTTMVTYQATDAIGNAGSCSFTVTVNDTENPVINCPANKTVSNDAGVCSAIVNGLGPSNSDNCGVTLRTWTLTGATTGNSPGSGPFTNASGQIFNVGVTTVTYHVEDAAGNSDECSFTVTVNDTENPSISCAGPINVNADPGTCTYDSTQLTMPSASDNCSVASVIASPAMLSLGSNTLTWTVTDSSGNTNSCTQSVTVVDNVAPTALCKNITIQLDASGNASIVAADIDNGSSDTCSAVTLSASKTTFTCADLGVNNVTLTVTDADGNSSNCIAVVSVEDNLAPTALCKNVTIQLDASGNASITPAQIDNGSSDNCGSVSLSTSKTAFTCANLGTNNVTLTVDDGNGNSDTCVAVVTVEDKVPPTVVCRNISVALNQSTGQASITPAQIDNGSSDNCGIANMTLSQSNFTCSDIGTKSVTLTVTDIAGNSSNCTATVTVTDNSTAATLNIQASPGTTVCADEDVTFSIFSSSNLGTPVYNWLVDDNDDTNGTVGFTTLGSSNTLTLTSPIKNGTKVKLSVTSNLFACPKESNTITMTVNSTVTPSVEIQVNDNTLCQGQSATFSTIPASTLNMGASPSYQWYLDSGSGFNPVAGATNSTYTGIFNNGDKVYLRMTPGPGVQCPDPNYDDSSVITMTVYNLPTVTANTTDTDICQGETIILTGGGASTYTWDNSVTNGVAFAPPVGTTLYTVTGTDVNGCTNTDSISITVHPLPTVIASATDMDICDGDSVTLSASGASTYTWDNGLGVGISHVVSPSSTTTYTVIGTDSNGCENTDSVTITVNSLNTPSVSITSDKTEICTGATVTFTATSTNGGASPSYQWYLNGGPVGSNVPNYSNSSLSDGDTVYVRMTPSSDICVNQTNVDSSSIPIDVYTFPAAPVTITGPQGVCPPAYNIVYSVTDSDSNVQSYTWTFPSGFSNIRYSNNGKTATVDYTSNQIFSGNITVTANNLCGNSSSTNYPVSTNTFLYVDAGPDQYICAGVTTVTLAGQIGGVIKRKGQWDWEALTPGGSFSDPDSVTSNYTLPGSVGPGGSVTIRIFSTVSNTNNTCSGDVEDFMTIYVMNNPTASFNSGPSTICQGDSTNILFTGTANTTVTFFDGSSNHFVNLDGTGTGTYNTGGLSSTTTFTLVSVAYTNGNICSQTLPNSPLQITVNPAATIGAGVDQTICEGDTATMSASIGAGLTGSWTSSSGNTNFSNNSTSAIYTPNATDIANGTVTLTYTTTNASSPCPNVSDAMVLTINPAPTVNAGADQTICEGSTATMNASLGGSASSGTWSSSSGNTNFSNNTPNAVYTPNATDISNGTVTLTYTTNDPSGPCGPVSDFMVLTINPIATVTAGPDLTICSNETPTMAGGFGGGASGGTWSKSGTGSFSNVNDPNAVYTPSASDINNGTVTLTYTTNDPSGPCGSKSDSMVLTIRDEIFITSQPQNVGICANNPTSLSMVAAGDDLQYEWYHNGSPIGNNSNVLNFPSAQVSDAGSYYVIVSSSIGACTEKQSNTVTLNVNEEIDIDVSGQPASGTRCEGDNYSFTVSASGSISTYQWYFNGSPLSNGGNISGATTNNLVLSSLTTGNAGNYYVVLAGVGGTCPSVTSATASLTVRPLPTVNAGPDQTICSNDIASLSASISGSASTGIWSSSSGNTTGFSNVNNPNATYTPNGTDIGNGIVTLTFTTTDAVSPCATGFSDSLVLTINPLPTATISYSGSPYCESDVIDYSVTLVQNNGSVGTYSYVVNSGGPTLDINTASGLISPNSSSVGTYTVSYTIPASSVCQEVVATFDIEIEAQPDATFSYSATNYCSNASDPSPTIAETGGTFTYSPAGLVIDSNTGVIDLDASTTNTYTVYYTFAAVSGGCAQVQTSQSITIDPYIATGSTTLEGFAIDDQGNQGPISNQILACHEGNGTLTLDIGGADPSYIVEWQYNDGSGSGWLPVPVDTTSNPATTTQGNPGNTEYGFIGLTGTYGYRAVINTGSGCGDVYSNAAYVSVIPPDLKPEPVQASPTAFCYGGSSMMSATTNYGAQLLNDEGLFNTGQINTQDPDSWLVDGAVRGLSASGNDLKNNNWSGTNPHPLNVNGTGSIIWDSGEPKYAIAGGVLNQNQTNDPYYSETYNGVPNTAMTTLTTPIFSLLTLQDATLTFDEAFVLAGPMTCNGPSGTPVNYPAGQALIQISTDGGSTWNNIPDDQVEDNAWRTGANVIGPANSGNLTNFSVNTTTLDLSSYFGQTSMRIRFVLIRNCESVWALDNIQIPAADGASTIEWTDQFDTHISYDDMITYTPITPGYQIFTVTSYINGCRSEGPDGSQDVPLTVDMAYAGADQTVSGCGVSAQLHAYDNTKKALQNYNELVADNNWPTPDLYTVPSSPAYDFDGTGATGEWSITSGPAVVGINWATENPADYFFPSPTDPRAEFAGPGGSYVLTWTVHGLGGDCSDSVNITLNSCATLDFDGIDDNVTFRNDYNLDSGPFSIEIWVKPDPTTELGGQNDPIQTILSKRDANNLNNGYDLRLVNNKISFNWNNGGSITHSNTIGTNRWYHVAVTFNGTNTYKMYIDGILLGSTTSGSPPTSNTMECIMGAMDRAAAGGNTTPVNYYSGWLDELRIWNVELSVEQIRHMMNQEIVQNGANVQGAIVPIDIPGPPAPLTWSNLDGYYRMNQATDVSGGYLLANAGTRDGQMRNITTWQSENSPLPYTTKQNGNWYDTSASTPWLWGNSVWDYPNALGIDGTTRIDWNIVRTSHNVESNLTSANPRDITVLGLLVDSGSNLTITAQGTQDETNTGHGLWVTHYLKLDGFMNLIGESQLVQKRYGTSQVNESLLDVASAGSLKRDQQGTNNLYNYNYWSSPVGPINTSANNLPYSLGGNFFDGTTSSNPQSIIWTAPTVRDAPGTTNPITISTRWIYTYANLPANTYSNWAWKGNTGTIGAGLGYTMKGSGVGFVPYTLGSQNYSFMGKPYNNTYSNLVSPGNDILVGNPYPCAIDANIFINENGPIGTNSINGTLYFWEHYVSSTTHILAAYEGGYAQYNLSGGNAAVTPPVTVDGYYVAGGNGTKIPGEYIAVAQGFFVTSSGSGGQVTFNNSQRIFQRETTTNASDGSWFYRTASSGKSNEKSKTSNQDDIKRLRLEFKTPEGAIRPLLLAFVPNGLATDGVDYGYDAPNYDVFPSDLTWLINNGQYVIQGVGDFDKSKQYPLNLLLSNNGEIEISLKDLENFDTPENVFVYDALLGTYTKINNNSFKMSLDANTYSNRFFIAFQPNNALSVEDAETQNIIVNYLSSSHEIYVKTIQSVDIRQVYLINMVGQTIKSWNATNLPMSNEELRIPVSNISSGNYILKVETSRNTVNKKVIIEN